MRFRQRLLHLDNTLDDGLVLDSPGVLTLVKLTFCHASRAQVRAFMDAKSSCIGQRMLQLPLDPDVADGDSCTDMHLDVTMLTLCDFCWRPLLARTLLVKT